MPTKVRDGDESFELTDVTVTAETDKALLVEYEGEPVWIPKSGLHDDSEVYSKNDSGDMLIKKWLARSKGWLAE